MLFRMSIEFDVHKLVFKFEKTRMFYYLGDMPAGSKLSDVIKF